MNQSIQVKYVKLTIVNLIFGTLWNVWKPSIQVWKRIYQYSLGLCRYRTIKGNSSPIY